MPQPDTLHRRRRDKEARPQELLDAALTLFVEKGFAATRTDEVAERAGVSKGTLYLYFASKEELLKAVIRHTLSTRIAEGAALVEGHTGSATELLDTLVTWWSALYDSTAGGVFKLIITEARAFPEIAEVYAREVVEPASALLRRVVQAGIDSGEYAPVNVDNAVHSLVLPLIMVCLHRHSLGACGVEWHLDGRAFIAHHVHLLLDGLRARAPAA